MSTSPFFFKAFLGNNGRPAASGWLFAYAAGSTTLKGIFADRNNTIPLTNPMRLDGNGVCPQFFAEAGLYDFKAFEYNFVTPLLPGPSCFTAEDIDGESGSGGGPSYVLPIATETILGGVKPDGATVEVDPVSGVLSVIPSLPELSGYAEGVYTEFTWINQGGTILGNSPMLRGTNSFQMSDFLAGMVMKFRWVGRIDSMNTAQSVFIEGLLNSQAMGQFDITPPANGDYNISYEATVYAPTVGGSSTYLNIQSRVDFSKNGSAPAAPLYSHTRYWSVGPFSNSAAIDVGMVVQKTSGGYQQSCFQAWMENAEVSSHSNPSAAPPIPSGYVLPVATPDILGGIRPDERSMRVGPTGFASACPIFSVTDYGATGDGSTPDQDAINAAIEAASSVVTQIVNDGSVKLNTVTSAVFFPAGVYYLSGPIKYRNGVSLYGASNASVELIVDFDGFAIEPLAYDGGVMISYADIHIREISARQGPGGLGRGIIKHQSMIRNCVDSFVRGFSLPTPFYFADTWTNVLENCSSYNSTGSHIYGDLKTGILTINGGRFDECTGGGPGVFMNSLEGELVARDCAVQFGNGAAFDLTCPSVVLDNVFIEGNCIDNPATYHVQAARPAFPNNQLSSFTMTNCVVNNRGQARRDGLGIVRAANFKKAEYRERWVRNGVLEVPKFPGCEIIDVTVNSASPRSEIITGIGAGSATHAVIRQVARPLGFFGQDMASDGTFAPTVRAAANFGFDAQGLALGTYNGQGAAQGFGTALGRSNVFRINPWGGDVYFGGTTDAKVLDGTNEFFGRERAVQTITASDFSPAAAFASAYVDCTAGSRTVTLSDAANLPENGRRILIRKLDSTPNDLVILHETGTILIDGQPSITLRLAGASVLLEGDGENFQVIASHLWHSPRLTVRTDTSTVASATRITRYTGTGGHEERLPSASVVCDERWYRNRGSGIWTLRCAGADQIDPGNQAATATTLAILPGQTVHLYCAHSEYWEVL